MSGDQDFSAAVEWINTHKKELTDLPLKQQEKLYGIYKQSQFGDNTSSRPWALQIIEVSKWDAWTSCKGWSQAKSKIEYIKLVNKVKIWLEEHKKPN